MADTGWKSPTTTGGVNNQWTDPTYAYESDNDYATVSVSKYLIRRQSYEDFSFGIPAGATIDGIEVSVEWYEDIEKGIFYVRLYSTSTSIWRQKLVPDRTSEGTDVVGGPTDLWTLSLVASDFSDTNFHMAVEGNGGNSASEYWLDHVQVKVYYTEAPIINETVLPSAIASTLTIQAPTVTLSPTISPTTLALAATLETSTYAFDFKHAVAAQALTGTVQTPTLAFDFKHAVAAQALSLTLQESAVTLAPTISPSTLALAASLTTPTLTFDYLHAVAAQALSLTLETPNLAIGPVISPDALALFLQMHWL